jgi:hypothetical protein
MQSVHSSPSQQNYHPGGFTSNLNRLSVAEVDQCVIRGLSWTDIATFFGVSQSALYRWRQFNQYISPTQIPSNDELDFEIQQYLLDNDERGEVLTMGLLRSKGFYVTRDRVRASIERVNPGGRARRRLVQARRVEYNVAGPHHLWHVDGCHKLIKYGMVVHGGIDGFSRAVMFLHCSNNNRASTVFALFIRATQVDRVGIPSRVRSDHGTENVDIARYMFATRGANRGSHLTGSSMRNQRIERLWRDCTATVLSLYVHVFKEFEERGVDFSNDVLYYILHRLFLNRINEDLAQFVRTWNDHSISSTVGSRTPNQLLLLHRADSNSRPPSIVDEGTYGVDGEVDEAEDAENMGAVQNQVVVPDMPCPLNEARKLVFLQRIRPLTLADPKAVFWDKFVEGMSVMNELMGPSANI